MNNWEITQEISTVGCVSYDHPFVGSKCECDDFEAFLPVLIDCGIYIYKCSFRLKNGNLGRGLYLILPGDGLSFHYQNEEIINNLNIFATHSLWYYRNIEGFVSGEIVDGVWQVKFDVTYGNKNKYRVRKL